MLESVGLLDRRDHYPIQLSGGEQQRVALARAFMVRPPILLADEPTGNLDTQNGQHVLELLISLNQREGTTLVLVTHDAALSARASRRITLRDGRIVSDERAAKETIMRFSWKTACKIAWRESRSSSFKFLFVILAVAVGVGSLTGVRGFSRAFHEMLLSQARTLMAADLSLRVFELPTPQQTAEMDALAKSGVDRTWITETVTMAAAGANRKPPMLVSVKAVDPKKYPFYGEIRLVAAGSAVQGADRRHRGRFRRRAVAFESEGWRQPFGWADSRSASWAKSPMSRIACWAASTLVRA